MSSETYPPLVDNPDIHAGPYTVPIVSPVSQDRNQLVMVSKFSNGDEQRRLIFDRTRTEIVAKHEKLTVNWYNKILSFYNDRNGAFDSFNLWFRWRYDVSTLLWDPWNTPAPYKYRFSEDALKVTSYKDIWFDVEVKLIETNELEDVSSTVLRDTQ